MRKHLLPTLRVVVLLTASAVSALAQAGKDNSGAPTANEPQPAVVPFDAETARRHQDAWAKHLSAEVTVENSIGIQFILVPAGESRMQDELDVVRTKAFYLGKT